MKKGYWIGHISVTDPEKYEEYKAASELRDTYSENDVIIIEGA